MTKTGETELQSNSSISQEINMKRWKCTLDYIKYADSVEFQ